jgi:uncharacterized membrane protein YqaE (UPF0057 family)
MIGILGEDGIMRYLLALLLPPAALVLCGKPKKLIANVPLTMCLWVPGVIHALLVVRDTGFEERTEQLAALVLAWEEGRNFRPGHRAHVGARLY